MRLWLSVVAGIALSACGRVAAPNLDAILADKPAPTLADYGLFEDAAGRVPVSDLVPYDLINPLYSDHAEKLRYVYVPDGQSAVYRETDVIAFPIGTVLVKTFAYDDDYLETRLLIHKADGWEAIPYVWNDAQTEAVYAPVGKRIEIEAGRATPDAPAFTYAVPNKNQCKTCHQSGDAVSPIGPKVRNLNHNGPQGMNQIADWVARGVLVDVPDTPPVMAKAFDPSASLTDQARAYLDINCAHCHKSTGSASNSGLWLEWDVEDAIKWGIGKHPTAAGRGAGDALVVIKPGEPKRSILAYRMASDEAGIAMPELGRVLIDEEGVALIEAWISEMDPDATTVH
ncbi:MAG: SO2930 family diheme c-type cytochrome [Pseudomonadota bacterium]